MMISRSVVALTVAFAVWAGEPGIARAAEDPSAESPRAHLEDATRRVLRAFELMLRAIPQYAAPEVMENGDIIIRRIHPDSDSPDHDPQPNADQPDAMGI